MSSGAARKTPVTAGSNCPPDRLAPLRPCVRIPPARRCSSIAVANSMMRAFTGSASPEGCSGALAVPARMAQRHDVRYALWHRQAPGEGARLVAMHLDEGIGTGLQPGDHFDSSGALCLRGILRQIGSQVVAHVLDVERIADGEGVVDRLFDAEAGRGELRRRGRAAEEAQQRRPVELLKRGGIEPHPLTDPGCQNRGPHSRPLRLTVGQVGGQRQGAKDFRKWKCFGGGWRHIHCRFGCRCKKHSKQCDRVPPKKRGERGAAHLPMSYREERRWRSVESSRYADIFSTTWLSRAAAQPSPLSARAGP